MLLHMHMFELQQQELAVLEFIECSLSSKLKAVCVCVCVYNLI